MKKGRSETSETAPSAVLDRAYSETPQKSTRTFSWNVRCAGNWGVCAPLVGMVPNGFVSLRLSSAPPSSGGVPKPGGAPASDVEDVSSIHSDLPLEGFTDLERLGDRHIGFPDSRRLDGVQAHIASRSRQRVLQDDIAGFVGYGVQTAERLQVWIN